MSLLSNFQDVITAVKMGLSKKVDKGDFNTALNLKADKTTVNALDARVTQVNQLVSNINSFTVSVVETLPTGDDIQENVIYFMPAEDEEDNNVYYEFMYIENDWELIGTTAVDLSNYPTTSDMESWVNGQGFAKSSNLAEVATTGAYASLSGAPSSSDVASNTSARHTHSNKTVIDKFSEVSGELKYDGSNVALEDALVATATFSGATQGSGYLGTLDKSNAEILDAFERGKNVWVEVSDGSGITTSVPISSVKDMGLGDTYQEITFSKVFVSSNSEMKEMILVVNSSSSEIYNFTYYETVPDYVSGSASSDITANTTARHTHSNKTVLDKFSESGGAVLYDGSEIGGGGFYVGDTAPQDTDVLWIDTSDDSLDLVYGYGTNVGDIPIWNGHNWETIPKWQMIYQPVEYVQGNKNPYINTGVAVTPQTRVIIDEAYTDTSVYSLEGINCSTYMFTWGITSRLQYFETRVTNDMSTGWVLSSVSVDTNRHIFDIKSGSQKIDDTETGTQTVTGTSPKPLILFARTHDSNVDEKANVRIYSCRIYDGDTLIRDYVPVYNIYTGEPGLFDKANGKFYGNAGSGTFTKGPDITPVSSLPTAIPDGTGGTY